MGGYEINMVQNMVEIWKDWNQKTAELLQKFNQEWSHISLLNRPSSSHHIVNCHQEYTSYKVLSKRSVTQSVSRKMSSALLPPSLLYPAAASWGPLVAGSSFSPLGCALTRQSKGGTEYFLSWEWEGLLGYGPGLSEISGVSNINSFLNSQVCS